MGRKARGGRTKWNRTRFTIPKTHALDAACAGVVDGVSTWTRPTLTITAAGRGIRQRVLPDQYGFPRGHRPRVKKVAGFQTGDFIKATVTKGKKAGVHIGRVAVRSSRSFNIHTANGSTQGIPARCCAIIQRNSGFAFGNTKTKGFFLPAVNRRGFQSKDLLMKCPTNTPRARTKADNCQIAIYRVRSDANSSNSGHSSNTTCPQTQKAPKNHANIFLAN